MLQENATAKNISRSRNSLLAVSAMVMLTVFASSCRQRDESAITYLAQLQAHQWVLDSSNTQTFAAASAGGTVTRMKGDSSMTLTYHQNTFDVQTHQTTETRNYQLDGLRIYYWNVGIVPDYTQFKTILNIDNASLSEQMIINGQNGSSTSTFNYYHAK